MGKRHNIALAFNNLFLQAAHCLFENGDALDNSSDSTLEQLQNYNLST